MKVVNFILFAAIVAAATSADAKDVMIRCTVKGGNIVSNNNYLDQKLNSRSSITSINRYLINDDTGEIYIIINGLKRPACLIHEGCELRYSDTTITMSSESIPDGGDTYTSITQLDRLAGTLTRTADNKNRQGQVYLHMEYSGNCIPESVNQRKF